MVSYGRPGRDVRETDESPLDRDGNNARHVERGRGQESLPVWSLALVVSTAITDTVVLRSTPRPRE